MNGDISYSMCHPDPFNNISTPENTLKGSSKESTNCQMVLQINKLIGPILLSDQPIYDAFKSEVIYKTSDLLKSQILRTVRNIFEYSDQLYAGIGNRENVTNKFHNRMLSHTVM